ncbi:cell division control protein Cdc6 [Candidatus Woesearchaeota archaeon CG10_big_fil_rev_8_21_14_0_10_34_12]|nr:MAG: cell division control protein Cdc6 [Candidatus Woesearchaeota archaeon CG10_big_fil_rev_8_21_14_0_10_34_12]
MKVQKIFDSFMSSNIFNNKGVLQSNYTPETIPHRDKEIEQIASILAPALRQERTSNLFVYGNTGTGKTLSIHYLKNELLKRSDKSPLRVEYLNCKLRKVADTEYRILAELIKKFGHEVPATGLPTDQVYNKFIEVIEQEKQFIILILDEVDQIVKKMSDGFLYNLMRINTELSKTQLSVIGISNDVTFLDNIDPRVRSSLSEEEIIFPPYNALQLQDILKTRAELAFKKNVVGEGVIAKCAAIAAREHGDARRALDLLRVAGELTEREGLAKISLKYIDQANAKIEKDKILSIIETEPKQFQAVILAIIELSDKNKDKIFTGEVYQAYQDVCKRARMEMLTQRRIGDIISEFDMLGLINASVISKGRYGKTREIKLAISKQIIERAKKIINESLGFA